EERAHRRMVGGEADRPRILAEITEPQWNRLVDQNAQDAPALREVADRGALLRLDPGREEPGQTPAGAVEHAKCRVARPGERRCGLDDPLQRPVERELRAHGDTGVDQRAQAELLARNGHPAIIDAQRRRNRLPRAAAVTSLRGRPYTRSV